MNKTLVRLMLLALLVAACDRQRPDATSGGGLHTYSSFDHPSPADKAFPARKILFQDADLDQVLTVYAEVSGRSLIRGGSLPAVKITFYNQTPMNAVEVLRALDTVLAAQGITTVSLGTQYIKVVPDSQAPLELGPVLDLPPDQLPDSSSFVTYALKVKRFKPSQAVPALMPFAKLPNSVIAIDAGMVRRPASEGILTNFPSLFGPKDSGMLVFRDYSSNVRRMVEMVQRLEQQ